MSDPVNPYPWQKKFADPRILAENYRLLSTLFRIIQCSGDAEALREIAKTALAEVVTFRQAPASDMAVSAIPPDRPHSEPE